MSEQIKGHCNCGNVTVSFPKSDLPESSVLCHCLSCRRSGGSVGSTNLFMEEGQFTISGDLAQHHETGTSGKPVTRFFCGKCGSPVYTKAISFGEKAVFLKGGLFDPHTLPAPKVEYFASNMEPWQPQTGDAEQVPVQG